MGMMRNAQAFLCGWAFHLFAYSTPSISRHRLQHYSRKHFPARSPSRRTTSAFYSITAQRRCRHTHHKIPMAGLIWRAGAAQLTPEFPQQKAPPAGRSAAVISGSTIYFAACQLAWGACSPAQAVRHGSAGAPHPIFLRRDSPQAQPVYIPPAFLQEAQARACSIALRFASYISLYSAPAANRPLITGISTPYFLLRRWPAAPESFATSARRAFWCADGRRHLPLMAFDWYLYSHLRGQLMLYTPYMAGFTNFARDIERFRCWLAFRCAFLSLLAKLPAQMSENTFTRPRMPNFDNARQCKTYSVQYSRHRFLYIAVSTYHHYLKS